MSKNMIAAGLMIVAVFFFSIMDANARGFAGDIPPLQVVWARYSFQLLLTIVILSPRLRRLLKTRYPGLQVLRSLFLFGASFFFFTGLSFVALADLTAIFEVAPLLITILAVIFLGERIGVYCIGAVLVGLVGAIIVANPSSFSPNMLYGFAAATCFACYAISTRFLGNQESPWTSFLYTALIGTLIASFLVPTAWVAPSTSDWVRFVLMGASGMVGHYVLLRALTLGEASFIAPFGYASLIFNGLWGVLFFAEIPSVNVVLGGALIVGAGLVVWLREQRQTQPASD